MMDRHEYGTAHGFRIGEENEILGKNPAVV
jgi:hypothetical protein